MRAKLFFRPLTLSAGGQTVTFRSPSEFEFSLAGRTDVPAKKVAELMLQSVAELKREAQSIKAIEQRFVETLSRELESPGSIEAALRELDPHVFSQDHSWREIMVSLLDKGSGYHELYRIALVKYLQYLSSRLEVIKHIYAIKKQAMKERRPPEEVVEPPVRAKEDDAQAAMRETVVLASQVIAPEPNKKDRYTRLPKGEPVTVHVRRGQTVELLLSKHSFKLKVDEEAALIGEGGEVYAVQPGKNIVGRDAVCNILIKPELRDVSRLHLILERLGPESFRLTDLSSHGTFLPSQLLG